MRYQNSFIIDETLRTRVLIANAWAKQGGAKNSVTSGDNLLSQSMVLKNYDNFSDLLGFLMIFISFM